MPMHSCPPSPPGPPCRAQLEKVEAEVARAEGELAALQLKAGELGAAEERYWRDFNQFQMELQEHMDERDALTNA
jgi:beclin 1